MKISHIQCRVNNIKKAVSNFEKAGFQVEWGRNPKNSLNAFIWFEQGPFIELFEMKWFMSPISVPLGIIYGNSMHERWMKWMDQREGFIDFALEGYKEDIAKQDNLQVVRKEINNLGIRTSKVLNGRRKKPTGEIVTYGFFSMSPRELPFVVSAYSTPQRPKHIHHSNGSKYIHSMSISCTKDSSEVLNAILKDNVKLNVNVDTVFKIDSITIEGLLEKIDPQLLHGANLMNKEYILLEKKGEVLSEQNVEELKK
ncbi:VOC family protein [Lysinibacillus sp. NPDC056185]|uniref:VOC family protein n=1 Tax=Lysinibacillus sp. NPDC056185 TaxID=3345739 RepID=UPI0039EE25E6